MNEETVKNESPQDEQIIKGLREAERFYEATSRMMNIPALVEEVRKRLESKTTNQH